MIDRFYKTVRQRTFFSNLKFIYLVNTNTISKKDAVDAGNTNVSSC